MNVEHFFARMKLIVPFLTCPYHLSQINNGIAFLKQMETLVYGANASKTEEETTYGYKHPLEDVVEELQKRKKRIAILHRGVVEYETKKKTFQTDREIVSSQGATEGLGNFRL